MDKSDLVLAVFSTSKGSAWTPVQAQKIFFLLDERIPTELEGPVWNFQPYDYGPFDVSVYEVLEGLTEAGHLRVENGEVRTFTLDPSGQTKGEAALAGLAEDTQAYVRELSCWVRRQSFRALVAAIYSEFPAMRTRSIFRG